MRSCRSTAAAASWTAALTGSASGWRASAGRRSLDNLSLRLSLRRVPGLSGPSLCTGAGLSAAGLCGSLSPTRSLLHQRLLLPARRWGDGRLFLEMGTRCAGSAPGALSTAGPLEDDGRRDLARRLVEPRSTSRYLGCFTSSHVRVRPPT